MKAMWMGAAALALAGAASAAEITDMVGTWTWEAYTVAVTECATTTVCAEVIAGPQNVGLQMLKTAPAADGDAWTAEVVHPATGEVYFSKMTFDGTSWTMAGCTAAGVCAEGTFTRQ